MDLGFSSLLEMFQDHFGKRAGKILVGIIGAAVTAFCLGLIFDFFRDLYNWSIDSYQAFSIYWIVTKFISSISVIILIFFVGYNLAHMTQIKAIQRESEEVLEEVVNLMVVYRDILTRIGRDKDIDENSQRDIEQAISKLNNMLKVNRYQNPRRDD